MNPTLSILTLSWNSREETKACIASIIETVQIPYELIIVDNNSQDDSVDMLRSFEAQYEHIRVITNAENRGYAAANNQAYAAANGEYIALLNSDTELQPGAIDGLVSFLSANADYDAATARLLNADESIQLFMHRRFPTLSRLCLAFIHKRIPQFHPKPVRDYLYLNGELEHNFNVEQPAGACILLRRSMIEKLGKLFDEEHFPLYYNDVDLAKRIANTGAKIAYRYDATIIHHKGTSVRKLSILQNSLHYSYAVLWYFKLHGSTATNALLRLLLALLYTGFSLALPLLLLIRAWNTHDATLLMRGWLVLLTLNKRYVGFA